MIQRAADRLGPHQAYTPAERARSTDLSMGHYGSSQNARTPTRKASIKTTSSPQGSGAVSHRAEAEILDLEELFDAVFRSLAAEP